MASNEEIPASAQIVEVLILQKVVWITQRLMTLVGIDDDKIVLPHLRKKRVIALPGSRIRLLPITHP
ncbi:MAG TPA: hypothetical protein PLZ56_11655, partial [Anaerolineae bacterium]|nr:hypothetical protein [Anaerolineae bacterium]